MCFRIRYLPLILSLCILENASATVSERTFIMVKPDGVQRSLIGTIIKRFEMKGFKLVALKFTYANNTLLKEHYRDLANSSFYPELIGYMSSSPVVMMVWEGYDIIKTARKMLGATNPADSQPGTIRGDFSIDISRNIIHGSDSVEAANREISLWFLDHEVLTWTSVNEKWIYE